MQSQSETSCVSFPAPPPSPSASPPQSQTVLLLAKKFPTRWSSKAIKSFAMSELEARKLKYRTTGTEALLMGVLIEGDGVEITTAHVLLGIWSEVDSAGHKILSTLGFNEEKAKELLESSIFKPGCTDD